MCLYPKIIKNRKYIPNKKNGGVVPAVNDERALWLPAGCGKCMECCKQKARGWQVRLHEEIKSNKKKAHFVTFTFSEEAMQELDNEVDERLKGYDRDNEISRIAVRRFTERWRKAKTKTIRHWLVTELGTTKTERLHIHGIVWTEEPELLKEKWKYGLIYLGDYVNSKTVNYIVKYLYKIDKMHTEYKPKMYVSQGIGKKYLESRNVAKNKFNEKDTDEAYITKQGTRLGLPVYYRNKIYNEDQREKLWMHKLDENIRYVDGEKVDVSINDKEYFKLLNEKRIKNKRLGYGDNQINWSKKKYEQEKRNLKRKERIEKLYRKKANAEN
jgi:hypothetical protein